MVRLVYALVDPRDLRYRYIGQTTNDLLEDRLRNHLSDKKQDHKTNWLAQLKSLNLLPIMKVLVFVDSKDEASRIEIALISKWRSQLTNVTAGGDGLNGYHITASCACSKKLDWSLDTA